MSYMSQNEDAVLQDRARRATAALYRVTDTLSDNEPMKWKLRNDAVEFTDTVMLVNTNEHMSSEGFRRSLLIADRLISKIAIMSLGGYVSKINFQVLEREYAAISDMLFKQMSDIDKGQNILSDIYIGQYKRHSNANDSVVKKDEKASKKTSHESSSISERQERVVSSLAGKGWLHILEIVNLCGVGASVKTIQRDLSALVEDGVLQSKGDRRWRTYALAENYKK